MAAEFSREPAILCLQGTDRRLSARGGALIIEVQGEEAERLSPDRVEAIHCEGPAEVTPAARNLCLRAGIDLLYFTVSGRYIGRTVGGGSRQAPRRLAQMEAIVDPARRLPIATAFVAAKIANTLAHLRRGQQSLHHPALPAVIGQIRALEAPLGDLLARPPTIELLDTLRGIEGFAARLSFSTFPHLLRNPEFSWAGRNRRPPRDPVNAALSFAYALLCSETESAVRRAGLELHAGFLHEAGRGAPALALDLAEEWRPLVDSLVLGLFNRRELHPRDFFHPGAEALYETDTPEPPVLRMIRGGVHPSPQGPTDTEAPAPTPPPAVWMSQLGRAVLLRAWARRCAEPVRNEAPACSLAGVSLPLREHIQHQAWHLSRLLLAHRDPDATPEQRTYQGFLWR